MSRALVLLRVTKPQGNKPAKASKDHVICPRTPLLIQLCFSILPAKTAMSCWPCLEDPSTNQVEIDRMLLVLSAPSVGDKYYTKHFKEIIDFHVGYAKAIIGHDNVVVLADAATMPYLQGRLPEDVLLQSDVNDIWMRDFTTVNPEDPVQFRYTWASMSKSKSKEVQGSFHRFADGHQIRRGTTHLVLDGGNIVDNYAGRVITTTRFLEDNKLTMAEGKEQLKSVLGATEVAILPPDDETLAHSDGMVMFSDADTLLVNDYRSDPAFRTQVLAELKSAFPGAKIVEVPVIFDDKPTGSDIGSAHGINVNTTATYKHLYVPTFGIENDDVALEMIRANTSKTVVPVPASGVCRMGGSVRCLTWQLTGENAQRLIEAARK